MAILGGRELGSNSRALITFFPANKAGKVWHIACFGSKRHYRPDGACVHTDQLNVRAKSPWHRSRLQYLPFGKNGNTTKRLGAVEESLTFLRQNVVRYWHSVERQMWHKESRDA